MPLNEPKIKNHNKVKDNSGIFNLVDASFSYFDSFFFDKIREIELD